MQEMTSCLLCLEPIPECDSFEITQEISSNFTIKNAIEEYLKSSKTIIQFQLRFTCSSCYQNLENFHNFATKVNSIYRSDSNLEALIANNSQDRQNFKEDADSCDQSFIDDLIEYDEDESVDFADLNNRKDQTNIEPEYNENLQSTSTNLYDSTIKQSVTDILTSQATPLAIQTLKNSPIRVTLPINFIKVSQSSFKILSPQTKHNKHGQQAIQGPPQESPSFSSINSRSSLDAESFEASHAFHSLKTSPNHPNIQNSPKNPKSESHKCEICIKVFKTSAILKSHIQKIHSDSESTSICKECGKVYTNKYILKTHMRKHIVDTDRTYECYICKKSSKNLPHLLDHFKYKHDPAYSTSSVCHICSKIVTRLEIHLRQMHSTDPVERVKCEICGHFMKKSSLKGHLASHNDTGFNCEACGKFLKNRNSLLCHMKRVHTAGKYKCDHCDKAFHQESRLMDHIACQHTGVFLHQCRIAGCEKKFRNAGRRRMHERRMHPADYEKKFKASYLRENLDIQ